MTDYSAADALMGIFGYKRIENMTPDITLCLGINCKVKKKCGRYGVKANPLYQSYMSMCVDKVAFKGKPRRKRYV